MFSGEISGKKNDHYLSNPMYEKIRDNWESSQDYIHTGRLVPIYPETAGVSSRWLRYIIKPLLNGYSSLPDSLPQNILEANGFMSWREAIKQIHFPESEEFAAAARKRFAFEELFLIQLAVLRERLRLNTERAKSIPFDAELIRNFIKTLPFSLTEAQRKAAFQILKDIEKPRPMNRLLQGDVGSGKTIVAMIAALNAAKTGAQIAVMVPTEILAQQHYAEFAKFLAPFNVEIGLLCAKHSALSSYGRVSKLAVLDQVKNGETKILIGTNALIQKGVTFKNLELIILDETTSFWS